MTQVLSSSPPSLSLLAFATFSLDEPPSAFQAQQSTTSRRADRDAHTAHTSVQSTHNTATGGVYSPRAASASSSRSTAMPNSHPAAALPGGANTPVNGPPAASMIEGPLKQSHSPIIGHARQQPSAALTSGDPSLRPAQNATLTTTSSTHLEAERTATGPHAQQPQMYYADTGRSPSPMAATPSSSNTSAPSSRSGTPVNNGGAHYRPQHHQYASSSSHRAPSPSPSSSYSPLPPSHHHIPHSLSPHQGGPNMAPTHQSPSHHPMHLNEANSAATQAAMMQAAYQQQQQHFQAQMNAMLAAGYSQHQLAQHFQQQQQQHFPSAAAHQHDPRRRAPSLPNSPNGGGLINNAGYFPSAHHHQQQQQYYHPQAQPSQHPQQQQYYHPHFVQQQQYPQSSPHIHHPHYSPYPSPPPIAPAMRASPASSPHGSPARERAPTAPSAFHSPISSAGNSPSGRITPNGAVPPFASLSRPSSPGGVADLARRRVESQSAEQRVPLAPTTAPQQQVAPSQRDRTASTTSEPRKAPLAATQQNVHARPSPSQLQHKGSADFAPPLPRIRTDSGISSSSTTSTGPGPQSTDARAASPASTTSDRAPTPTQALHAQLAGSSTSSRSGRTTPTATSSRSSSPAAQQQSLGLQPSIRLTNGHSHDVNGQAANGTGIIRKASPLSQQSSYSDGHRSITPTQASPSGLVNGHIAEHDSDQETEEITSQHASKQTTSKHRATLSNASSAMSSSPQTSSSGKSGSSLFRNKLRKAISLSELNNSSSTLSSGDASSSSNKLGRTSLTSNSSSSDASHSINEPHTPPNGAPPVLPRGFASASASNLNSSSADLPNDHGVQNGRATPSKSGSMPSNGGRRFGILNSKMNASTDNISISSTVSSASMMLRKMGNFGKLARKSSVRSLSNLFHRDKHDKEDSEGGDRTGSKATSDAVSEFGVPGAAMLSSKDRKKGTISDPSTAHVTVELERGEAAAAAKAGMTPAEALVRKHQERERVQRMEEERIVRSRTASTTSSVGGDNSKSKNQQDVTSPRSKLLEKEKERLKNQNAGKKSLAKKFSFGAFSKSASSSSLRQEALHASTNSSAQNSEDKDSPRSSSSSSSANASPIFDSSATSSSSASPVMLQHELDTRQFSKPLDIDFRPSLDGVQLDTWRSGPAAISGISMHPLERRLEVQDEENDEGFDDRTPRQSMELISDQSASSIDASSHAGNYSDWDGEPPNGASFFDDDTASFRDDSDHTARSTVSNKIPFYIQQEPEEYASDSGADGNGRNGQAIPKRPPPHARPAKGILKYARSYSQNQLSAPQPAFAGRPRANSYDAPHQMHAPNQPGQVATLAQYIPTSDELDGVAHHPASASRLDTRVPSPRDIDHDKEHLSPSSASSFSPGTSPYNHPNTSEPILSNLKSVHMATRSVTGPIIKRNISFAQNLSVHTTWSGSTYDRRGDTATCNRLTPQLAQAIKEELNAFKMDEMAVHHQSRGFTHFFV